MHAHVCTLARMWPCACARARAHTHTHTQVRPASMLTCHGGAMHAVDCNCASMPADRQGVAAHGGSTRKHAVRTHIGQVPKTTKSKLAPRKCVQQPAVIMVWWWRKPPFWGCVTAGVRGLEGPPPPAQHGLGGERAYARSPRMRRASWMSLGMMVTRLAWMAHRLVSSKRPTR